MKLQSINSGMINKTFQKSDQTMPMAKTNNANSSPVADNNITYSIYKKNSSGTVSFSGEECKMVLSALRKLKNDKGKKILSGEYAKYASEKLYNRCYYIDEAVSIFSELAKMCDENGMNVCDTKIIDNIVDRSGYFADDFYSRTSSYFAWLRNNPRTNLWRELSRGERVF